MARYWIIARARRSVLVVRPMMRSCWWRRLTTVGCGSAAAWLSTTATSAVSWTSRRSSTPGVRGEGPAIFASRRLSTVCLTIRSRVHATSEDISRPATSASKVTHLNSAQTAVYIAGTLYCTPGHQEARPLIWSAESHFLKCRRPISCESLITNFCSAYNICLETKKS